MISLLILTPKAQNKSIKLSASSEITQRKYVSLVPTAPRLVSPDYRLSFMREKIDFFFIDSVPWFPRKLTDLDTFAEKVLEMGEELSKRIIIFPR